MKTVTLECKQEFYDNGQIMIEEYYIDGKLHNENGIAYKSWYNNGQIKSEEFWLNDKVLTKEQFEKINNPTSCNGKIIEIDGNKYKLTAI